MCVWVWATKIETLNARYGIKENPYNPILMHVLTLAAVAMALGQHTALSSHGKGSRLRAGSIALFYAKVQENIK